ncbi:uncharacterized protein LOC135695510 isoform X2 [Rhopilema esculentum]|uniref:uncharacterized protein LOC135695510 isoform X2 n=1 Tax=Rhopilema esculentum TaxID=499914 RepID=UPI0031CF4445
MNGLKHFTCILMLVEAVQSKSDIKRQHIDSHTGSYLTGAASVTILVASAIQCSHKCLRFDDKCIGANFNTKPENGNHQCQIIHSISKNDAVQNKAGWTFMEKKPIAAKGLKSCKEIKNKEPKSLNGKYRLSIGGKDTEVYCDMENGGYTLIARFSNADNKTWMHESGDIWYSMQQYGNVTSSSDNNDMLSQAFSKVSGDDIKVTRNDDPGHTALLLAAGCLTGKSMRQKMASFGDFRNGKVWSSSNRCLGNCSAVFSGQYATTVGFKYATSTCITSNDILNGNNIGFWCRYSTGDGSVIMIGGGGASCARADHGIGVTEEDNARLGGSEPSKDFGNEGTFGATTYSLNLWIK